MNAYKRERNESNVSYSTQHSTSGLEHRPLSLEFWIADPTLESQAYGPVKLIPPEKRAQAQELVEKIANAFKPTNLV